MLLTQLLFGKGASQHKVVADLPAKMPVGPKGQAAWITSCALELAALLRELPHSVTYLSSVPKETLSASGHTIKSDAQLAVIRQHTTHADKQLRKLYLDWSATADGQTGQIRWKTTDNIQRWIRFSKVQPELLCVTVV